MASTLGFREGLYLVWTTEKPYLHASRTSPVFSFQGSEWYFKFDTANEICYWVKMKNKHQKTFQGNCEATTYIENGNEEINDSVFSHVHTVSDGSLSLFYTHDDAIIKAIPDFHSIKILRLTFIFQASGSTKLYLTPKREKKSLCCENYPCTESLSQDFRNLLVESPLYDVELKCEGHSAKAHKAVLCARSKVFAAMLQNDMAECRTGVVKIQDMDADILRQFLQYLYTGTLPELNVSNAKQLYEAGDKYAVQGLKRKCADFLTKNFTEENACELFVCADAHSDKEFRQNALTYILNERIPLSKDHWPAFCNNYPKLAIEVLNCAYEFNEK